MQIFIDRYWLHLLLLAVVITRTPYLTAGYGSDPDAWLVASSALTLWHTGEYFPSRLPGYPLHEIVLSAVVPFGSSFLSNTFTLLFSLAAIVIWSRIAQRHSPHPKLLTLALAFSPVVWQHSADTMDYLWSLCFVLAAFFFAEKRTILTSAVSLGLAIGFRLSNAIVILPLAIFLILNKHSAKDVVLFCTTCAAVSVVAYLPPLTKYGLTGWIEATRVQMSDIHPESLFHRAIAFAYRTVYSLGPIPAALAGIFIISKRRQLGKALHALEPIVTFSVLIVIVYLILFWMIPLERAYLLPAMPFFFLLVSRVSSTKKFVFFTSLLILSGLINFDVIDRTERRQARLNIHEGIVIEEYMLRKKRMQNRLEIAALSFSHNAIVMHGDMAFWFENPRVELAGDPGFIDGNYEGHLQFEGHRKLVRKRGEPNVLFITYLLRHELEQARKLGYTVYCLTAARRGVEIEVGYKLEDEEVSIIDAVR